MIVSLPAWKCDAILGRAVATSVWSRVETTMQTARPSRIGMTLREGSRFVWSVSDSSSWDVSCSCFSACPCVLVRPDGVSMASTVLGTSSLTGARTSSRASVGLSSISSCRRKLSFIELLAGRISISGSAAKLAMDNATSIERQR